MDRTQVNPDRVQEPAADKILDARGLRCPLPVLRAKKALAALDSGQRLKIVATDPGSLEDFPVFARQTGSALEFSEEREGEYIFVMRKA